LVVPDKATRVENFHRNTLHALKELVEAAGLTHPSDIEAHHIVRRVTDTEVSPLSKLMMNIPPGALLKEPIDLPYYVFRDHWSHAHADSFQRR
jgi:hypothetical protein